MESIGVPEKKRIVPNGKGENNMNLFFTGNKVKHENKLWYITGLKEKNGRTLYCLKRGCYTKEVDETEIERCEE